jgi:alginate O-acetyltransferase complex protein AlgI
VLGAVFFSFQIYGDFSGYSDIAIGASRLFGFDLKRNFNFPYFSRDIAEFWRRWHISLSTWFRDYLYIPLGGSRGGNWMKIRNTFAIFLVSGFWHGANWTFIAWGALNALYILPLILTKNNRKNLENVAKNRFLPTFREFFMISLTFGLTVFAWIFFKAKDMTQAFDYISGIFSSSIISKPEVFPIITIALVFIFVIVEWIGREGQYGIAQIGLKWKWPFRFLMYYAIIIAIFWFGGKEQEFIYFQF